MKGKIKSVVPQMDQHGNQRSFSTENGTFYCFIAEMEDGLKGEVNSKRAGEYRFGAGDEVEYTYTPNPNPQYLGKLKIEQAGGRRGGGEGGQQWTPEREASVSVQGYLKSIIESGAPKEQYGPLLVEVFEVHDKMVARRLGQQKIREAAQPAQPTQSQGFRQPSHQQQVESIRQGQPAPAQDVNEW